MRHGLLAQGPSNYAREEPSLWRVLEVSLQRGWSREVRSWASVRTDDGRTRALLRAALNGKYLDHLLHAILPIASYPTFLPYTR